MAASDPFTWIITGATRGFGRAIAEVALGRGDSIVAAVRRPAAMQDLVDRHPHSLEVVEFDARDVGGVPRVVDAAAARFGRVDVLVNNAGRGYVGAAEEVGEDQLRESLALHLFVPAALVRAVMPTMRAQGAGTIVQMSSQGGRFAFPGVGAYCAGKFALEGWSEALAGEVAPFGIRVMLVEPSRFRTAFNRKDVLAIADVDDTYRDALAAVRAGLVGADGAQEGDPEKAAAIIVKLAHGDEVPLRLPLGAEAVQRIGASYRAGLTSLAQWADVARGSDFAEAVVPVDRPI
ncbi:SDR family oxidoreductase [Pseudofrankia asymbiotica]|uniref:Short-chain dehydrogenase/reductase n=1 Tax=Pseudofrankia asymbiotica TaxID=1834516 RepID=A0A1V2I1H3_9ACTN|nr:SDR family oxidoreductase [Pseudofrankia asymbiotica]ONH23542.1 short-chain dehydrogenase/reductase [Pseudofrankia asymbiotica]